MGTVNYKTLLSEVASWMGISPFPAEWSGVDVVLPLLEQMRQEGAVFFLKWDGERKGCPYTAWVGGPIMQEDYFRTDASSLEQALAYIIVHYAQLQWGFPMELFQ